MAVTRKVFHPDLDLAEALSIAEAVAAHYAHGSLLGQPLLGPILEARGAERGTMGPHLLAALDALGRTGRKRMR